jgi:hypothetical protein
VNTILDRLRALTTPDEFGWYSAPAVDDLKDALTEIEAMRADAERLNWLQENEGCNLISDDGGKWALSTMGMQPVPDEGGFTEEVEIVSIVQPGEWRESVRAAIDAARAQHER